MTRTMLAVVAAALLTSAVPAESYESGEIAAELGSIIGSEAACGLTYDQEAIARFIAEHVPAADMGFARLLYAFAATTSKFDIKEMSKSNLTAHCAQIKRVAKQYGFVR